MIVSSLKFFKLLHQPKNKSPRFLKRHGFGTLEVVIIIAVILSIALIFRSALTNYANRLIQTVFGNDTVIDDLAVNP